MENLIVTAGEKFTDIDALACAIAYAELLRLEGRNVEVVLPGPLNCSVTPTIKSWGLEFYFKPSFSVYSSVLVDISEESHFADCVKDHSISEIYDHRYGFQEIWNDRIGERSHIEFVGSCATLIWEEFQKRGFAEKISVTSARFLVYAIISNTLNFKAQVTHERDLKAYADLQKYAVLDTGWSEQYFTEQESAVFENVAKAIKEDTKVIQIQGLPGIAMGQLELWDGSGFVGSHVQEIQTVLKGFGEDDWFMSVPSIKEGKNHLYTESDIVRDLLIKYIGAKFESNSFEGTTERLWLRKEVRAALIKGVTF